VATAYRLFSATGCWVSARWRWDAMAARWYSRLSSCAMRAGWDLQSGWVDYRSSILRDRRPRQRLVAGGAVPSISLGHRERRGNVGQDLRQRGWPNPSGTHLTCRWYRHARRTSPRDRGASGEPDSRVGRGVGGWAWVACAARARSWVRIWLITDVWVMNATIRIAPCRGRATRRRSRRAESRRR
jgi:hypothetical protein